MDRVDRGWETLRRSLRDGDTSKASLKVTGTMPTIFVEGRCSTSAGLPKLDLSHLGSSDLSATLVGVEPPRQALLRIRSLWLMLASLQFVEGRSTLASFARSRSASPWVKQPQ
ncbi:hypothetical protein NL676_019475 [Syzygium grande]|nr:hypothetical protein NL676_019475 [Syzygium grande]